MDERREISKAFDEYVQDLVESGGLTACDYESFEAGWQAARQAPASGEVEPVGEIEHDYNLLKVRWYSHPKYGQFKTGDKVYVAHPPAKVPEGWNIEMIGDEIRIDTPNDAHFKFARDSRMPNHALPNMLYDLGSALLTTPTPATTPQPEGDGWIKCSDIAPVIRQLEQYDVRVDEHGGKHVCKSFAYQLRQITGLKRPQPPVEQEGK